MQNDTDSSLPYPTLLVHADDHLSPTTDIAPPLHPSTTYHYPPNIEDWVPLDESLSSAPVYSRVSYSTTGRVEKVLGDLTGGIYPRMRIMKVITVGLAVTYCSGLSAIHALFVHINPKRICISSEAGYHGTKGVADIVQRLNNAVNLF
jgi:cystathionine beta-lyase/cystathionine gamma-synthase